MQLKLPQSVLVEIQNGKHSCTAYWDGLGDYPLLFPLYDCFTPLAHKQVIVQSSGKARHFIILTSGTCKLQNCIHLKMGTNI